MLSFNVIVFTLSTPLALTFNSILREFLSTIREMVLVDNLTLLNLVYKVFQKQKQVDCVDWVCIGSLSGLFFHWGHIVAWILRKHKTQREDCCCWKKLAKSEIKDESGQRTGINIDADPIWKLPYFFVTSNQKKTILTSFLPSPTPRSIRVKLLNLLKVLPVFVIKNSALMNQGRAQSPLIWIYNFEIALDNLCKCCFSGVKITNKLHNSHKKSSYVQWECENTTWLFC